MLLDTYIVKFNEINQILKNGSVKSIIIISLLDGRIHIDVTFTDYFHMITNIASTNAAIKRAGINIYHNMILINLLWLQLTPIMKPSNIWTMYRLMIGNLIYLYILISQTCPLTIEQ